LPLLAGSGALGRRIRRRLAPGRVVELVELINSRLLKLIDPPANSADAGSAEVARGRLALADGYLSALRTLRTGLDAERDRFTLASACIATLRALRDGISNEDSRRALGNAYLAELRDALDIRDESWPLAVERGYGRDDPRWRYQAKWVDFGLQPGETMLDIGSGNEPHPRATHLADRYGDDDFHRGAQGVALTRDERPLVYCDLQALPFGAGVFDFVYCSHVLEHVDEPVAACTEIVRVGRRGYIETPTRLSDVMLNFTRIRHHKWHISAVGSTLVFMPYMQHEYRDTGTNAFFSQFHSEIANPFQRVMHENRDLFENMHPWNGGLHLVVLDTSGSVVADAIVGDPAPAAPVRIGPIRTGG
jgi:SAM-dependent methyltransferase